MGKNHHLKALFVSSLTFRKALKTTISIKDENILHRFIFPDNQIVTVKRTCFVVSHILHSPKRLGIQLIFNLDERPPKDVSSYCDKM